MTYIVKVWHHGKLTIERVCEGMAQVEQIQVLYDGIPGYEFDFEPDTFRYIRNHTSIVLA